MGRCGVRAADDRGAEIYGYCGQGLRKGWRVEDLESFGFEGVRVPISRDSDLRRVSGSMVEDSEGLGFLSLGSFRIAALGVRISCCQRCSLTEQWQGS